MEMSKMEKLELLCKSVNLCGDLRCTVSGYDVQMMEEEFKELFGQGMVTRRGGDMYPYEHAASVNGIKVFCIGEETL